MHHIIRSLASLAALTTFILAVPEAQAQDSDLIPVGLSPVRGPADAPITIVEFGDLQCPFTGRAAATMSTLLERHRDVRLVFKHDPLAFHKDAATAAEAAVAAGDQGRFWEMHDLLFANQRALSRGDLEAYAGKLGLDMARFRGALDAGQHRAVVATDLALAAKLGVRGTPAFFINGTRVSGAQPLSKFEEIIAAERAAMRQARGPITYRSRVQANYTEPAAPPPRAPVTADTTVYKVPLTKSPARGAKRAVVTIVEFSDFQCPFCRRAAGTLRQLLEEYEGKVRVVFKHNPLAFHRNADLAARAAIAAGRQRKFWEMHDLLFANQRALSREDLEGYGRQLGLNMGRFRRDLDGAAAKKRIARDAKLAADLGARGTPAFFINGVKLSGAQPIEKFRSAVDNAMLRAEPLVARGLKGDVLYRRLIKKGKVKAVAPVPPTGRAPDTAVYNVPIGDSAVRGARRALVTVVVFSDFQCPFCARATGTVAQLLADNPKTVRFVFKHNPLPFHHDAKLAAKAAMAAGRQGKFWEMHDLLFANNKALKPENLEAYAMQLGLDPQRLLSAVRDTKLENAIGADMALAKKLGANGTPTFFINGVKLVGAQPLSAFQKAVDDAIERAKPLSRRGLRGDALYNKLIRDGKRAN